MSASRAGEPAVSAGGSQAVCDSATRLEQPTKKQSIPASQIQGIRENHRVRNGDTPAGPIPGSLFSASSSRQVGQYQYQKVPKRKRGKHGPDSRISPMEESAITKAIRTSTSRKGEPVFLPAVGMEFNSAKEAKDFYNLYSWEIGFGIRRGRKKPNGNNYITRQDLVCSCEGLSKREATWRTGCKAMVRLHRTSDHGWVISRFKMQHNHHCSATNGPNKQWPSHSDIDPMTKDVVQKLRENNKPIGRACTGEDDDTRTFPEAAGGLSLTKTSDGMEEVLGTSGLNTVVPKEERPLCNLEPSLPIQRMATPEEAHPLGSGFLSGGDGDGEDEEDAEEDEEAPYEEPEDPFPGMSGRRRPTEEEMDPNYIPGDEPPAWTSGGTRELKRRKRPLPTEMEMEDGGLSSAPSGCLRPDREGIPASNSLPASAQTIVADSLVAASEHHLPLSTATQQELTNLSRENEEMMAELGKLRGELNLFRSEAERVKRENSQLSRDLEKAIAEKYQCRDTYGRARAVLRQLKLELDPGELSLPHPQGDDDDSDSSDACLFGRVVDRLELVPGVVTEQCLKAARFVAQGTVEVVLSHYMRLHPQVGLQLLVEAVLEEDLLPAETDEALALHDRVLEGARRIAHQCVQAPVEDEEDTSAGDAFSE